MDATQVWDDLIVGAGSAGAVLASRLSEQPGRRVLLLEAGPDFSIPDQLPAELKDAVAPLMSGYHWDFSANLRSSGLFRKLLQSGQAPDTGSAAGMPAPPLANARPLFPYPLGKITGGGSAVNGTLALRGLPEDFDRWAALGNTEWSWPQVLPYFKKLETDHDFSDQAHGAGGPLPINRPKARQWHALQAAFHQACESIGFAHLPDFNASSLPGVGPVPSNSVDQLRISTATAYLASVRTRPNLTIRAGCVVNRLLFDGQRVIGVELVDASGQAQTVLGKRITLSAGAINTPVLLQRSGVGNARLCRALGIAPLVDLPGVGENLMDHPALILWMTPKAGVCQEGQPYHQIMARAASKSDQSPDLNLFMLSNVVTAKIPLLSALLRTPVACGISVVLANPASRGRVFLDHAAPGSNPVIDLNLLSMPEDIESLMQGVRLAWKIAQSQPIAERIASVFMWTDAMINNDGFLKSAINRFIGATWHATGTAKMGPATDPMAVVDQHCRVHQLENLRVVDASVMPAIPGAATNLTCIMLAERAAEWMTQEPA